MPIYHDSVGNRTQFSLFHRSLMESDSSPLAATLADQRIAEVFAEEGISFGEDDGVYSQAITLWALLSQVFFKAEQRSCLAAVVRIAALWLSWGRVVSSTNTGAYCRARRQLTGEALQKISRVIAADTEANQAEYPQNPAQKAGLGFPILRGVALTCMHTGILLDAAVGPYSGKGTGETALLWKLLDALRPGDLVVADSYYCTYWLLAECRRRGAHVVMRNHHLRDDSPADARRLTKGQCVAAWVRPPRPAWMDEAKYATMPPSIEVRLVESVNEQPGQRTEKFTLATTLLDPKQYDARWLAAIYRGRWRVELDIRGIKVTLGMDVLRAKTPEMVRTELWSCLLAYNLIREAMLRAAERAGRCCRSMSLTAAMQMLGALWLANAIHGSSAELRSLFQKHQLTTKVGHRPGRNEPRVNKRRPKILKLMTQPRPKKAPRRVA